MLKIGGLQKLTLIDYPKRVACTVFLIGCNFRCPFCYNGELVLPEKIKKQPVTSQKVFFEFLKSRIGLLDGVCITGGEPTINNDLPQFIKKIKKMGFLVKLDTNGTTPQMIKELIKSRAVDYIAMDIKSSFSSRNEKPATMVINKYDEAAGVKVDLKKIRESIDIIKKSGVDYEFRTTIVPGIHLKGDIVELAREISTVKRYYLQEFKSGKNINGQLMAVNPYSRKELLDIRDAIAFLSDICEVR